MKASQITTRNRSRKSIVPSLAALTVLTFFVAGPADARCSSHERQVRIESRLITTQDRGLNDLGTDFRRLSQVPRNRTVNNSNRVYNPERGDFGRPPLDVRGIYLIPPVAPQDIGPMNNGTTYNIGDTDYERRRAEERAQRQRIIEGLKQAGVIRERNQPATTTTPKANGTKPKPKRVSPPKRKPQPKVTKLPNGDQITVYPDGLRVIKLNNGDTVSTYPNGKRVVTNSKGDTTVTEPGGYRKTTNRYGDGTARFPDGTRIDFKASGEATLTTPQGRKFHRMPGKGFKEVD